MTPRSRKRLRLGKQTIGTLTPSALGGVAGGFLKTEIRLCSGSVNTDCEWCDEGAGQTLDGCTGSAETVC